MLGHRHDQERQRQHRRRPRTAGSCRPVRGCPRRRRSGSSAPAPCRRSGSCPAPPARSPGASGRSTASLRERHWRDRGRRRLPSPTKRWVRRRSCSRQRALQKTYSLPAYSARWRPRPGPRSCRRPGLSPDRPRARGRGDGCARRRARRRSSPGSRRVGTNRRDSCHGADVDSAAATIKQGARKRPLDRACRHASGLSRSGGAVENDVEPLAGRVVQTAYMIEFGRREPGVSQEPEKRVTLIGADQSEGAARVSQQVLRRAARVRQHRPGAEQETRLGSV